jgi:hypothetical protein
MENAKRAPMGTTRAPERKWLAHDRFETIRRYLALTAWLAGLLLVTPAADRVDAFLGVGERMRL